MADELKPENKALVESVLGYGTARTYNRHEIDRLIDAARAQGPGPGEAVAEVEPIGWVSETSLLWLSRASETTLKITRHAQPEYGFTRPLYAATPTREA